MQQDGLILPEGVTVRHPLGKRYLIEGVLGKGEFGAVYLVRERDHGNSLFALKEVINPNKVDREHFAFECEILKRLNHRALPRVYDVFENDKLKRVYLLMDYIEGQNLEELRAKQPQRRFPLQLVRMMMEPVVDALIYLHTQDPPVVHRDIKPANIIISLAGGGAMLADFGSAKEYEPGAGTTLLSRRSPGYAALEQYRTGTGPQTDIYGLAATLYALLTGSVPTDAPARVMALASGETDPLKLANLLNPAIPQTVAEALQRGMSLKIAHRFETVEKFWRVFMASNTLQLSPITLIDPPEPSSSEQEGVDTGTISLENEVQHAPHVKIRDRLPIILCLLTICMGGITFFSYRSGFTILFYCDLAVLLVALSVLLYGVYSRAREARRNATNKEK